MTSSISQHDLAVRTYVYRHFLDHSMPPSVEDTAAHFRMPLTEAAESYQRLHDGHFLFLEPGTHQIRMANPLSAVPTKFQVYMDGRTYWANCAWDMLGIPAMIGKDAAIRASFENTGQEVEYAVTAGSLDGPDPGVVHFPLPVSQWYDDLVLT